MHTTAKYKALLEAERATLEKELASIGHRVPGAADDWEAVPEKMDVLPSDPNEVADKIEAYEENTAVLKQLEIRWRGVVRALRKIEEGTYGICEISGEPIETERLDANPAARTNKANKDKEAELPV